MSAADDFETALASAVASLLKPLTDAMTDLSAGDVSGLQVLLSDLGWGLGDGAGAANIQASFGSLGTDLSALATAVSDEDAGEIASAVAKILSDIANFTAPTSIASLPAPLNSSAFWSGTDVEAGSFAQELFDHLVFLSVSKSWPFFFFVLRVTNIFTEEPIKADPANQRGSYLRRRIAFDQLAALLNDPGTLAKSLWAQSPFDPSGLIRSLQSGLSAFGFQTFSVPADARLDLYYASDAPARANVRMLAFPVYSGVAELAGGTSTFEVTANVMPIPSAPLPQTGTSAAPPSGLSIFAEVIGNVSTEPVSLIESILSFTVESGFSAALPSVDIYPTGVVSGPGLTGSISDQFSLTWTPDPAFTVIGSADSTCISVSGATLTTSLNAKGGALEFKVELDLVDSELVIDLGDSDGFLQQVLGSDPTTISLPGGASWSSVQGFQLAGQAALAVTIPIHATFADVIDLESISVGIGPGSSGGVSVAFGLSGGLDFGPFSVVVDKLGIKLDSASSPDANGKMRVTGVSFGFKPPDGLGMSIDATPISGGGYVSFGQNQYVGWLELSVDILDLKVFGLLDTSPVSFLLIVQAGFPPIQLGFGFTLNDVGGLVGINRTMSLDALRAALTAGTLTDTLFLDDPVSQAPQLVATVTNMFPPQQGHYVFGPMCKIGWGDPTLIEAELGFLIEFPDPIRIAIFGGIVCALPDEDAALVQINLDVLGTIDFGIQLLTIDATMYDSYVLAYSLAGDMSFRLSWGAQTNFALSIGGFNPKYQPPPGFPSPMTPMTVSIGDGQNPYIGVSGYMAVTSNSLQLGAQAELLLASGSFSVSGYIGFDTLFILAPQFSFEIDLAATVDVLQGSTNLFCVDLALTLTGPTPWNAQGTASFSVLCINVSFDANVTWGSAGSAALAPVLDTIAPLTAALSSPKSWQSVLPSGADVFASFVATPPDSSSPSSTSLLHPTGTLQVSQTVLPLGTQIQRFGNGTPANADYFAVEFLQGGTNQNSMSLNAEFALGQFFILTDDEKLTDPAFDALPGGAAFGSAGFSSDPQGGVSVLVAYQDFIVDDLIAPSCQPPAPALSQIQVDPLAEVFARSRAQGTRAGGRSKYATIGAKALVGSVDSVSYVVTDTTTLAVQTTITAASGVSKLEARARLAAYLAEHPDEQGQYQIMPSFELVASPTDRAA